MIYIILALALLLFGVFYAVKPDWLLRRKYIYEEIPEIAIRAARVVGGVMAAAGAGLLIYQLYYFAAH